MPKPTITLFLFVLIQLIALFKYSIATSFSIESRYYNASEFRHITNHYGAYLSFRQHYFVWQLGFERMELASTGDIVQTDSPYYFSATTMDRMPLSIAMTIKPHPSVQLFGRIGGIIYTHSTTLPSDIVAQESHKSVFCIPIVSDYRETLSHTMSSSICTPIVSDYRETLSHTMSSSIGLQITIYKQLSVTVQKHWETIESAINYTFLETTHVSTSRSYRYNPISIELSYVF